MLDADEFMKKYAILAKQFNKLLLSTCANISAYCQVFSDFFASTGHGLPSPDLHVFDPHQLNS